MSVLGEYLGDNDGEAMIRGHVTAEEAAPELEEYGFIATGPPFHTWGRWGLGHDGDYVLRTGFLYTSPAYAGQRGAFQVTAFAVRKVA